MRSKIIKRKLNKIVDDLTSIFGNRKQAGNVVLINHYFIISTLAIYFLLCEFNLLSVVLVLILLITNIIADGCLYLKLERACFNDKNWFGAWNILGTSLLKYLDLNSKKIIRFFMIAVIIYVITMTYKCYRYFYILTEEEKERINIYYTTDLICLIPFGLMIMHLLYFLII